MFRILIAAALALFLAACSTTGGVTIEKDKVSGMDSRDAAYATATKSYHESVVNLAKEQKPACRLKAVPGQVLKIEGLEELSCYSGGASAAAAALPPPERPKTEFAENAAAAGGLVKDVGSVVIPVKAIGAASDALKTVVNSNTAATAGAINLGSQGLNRKPDVIITNTSPDGASVIYPVTPPN